jgi:hypothetical protein
MSSARPLWPWYRSFEVDLLAVRTFLDHYTVGVKYVDYDADENVTNRVRNPLQAAEISKVWAFLDLRFP